MEIELDWNCVSVGHGRVRVMYWQVQLNNVDVSTISKQGHGSSCSQLIILRSPCFRITQSMRLVTTQARTSVQVRQEASGAVRSSWRVRQGQPDPLSLRQTVDRLQTQLPLASFCICRRSHAITEPIDRSQSRLPQQMRPLFSLL